MNTNLKALKRHQKYYEDPIVVKCGDTVVWKSKESEWPGWIWCLHPISMKVGWVPENCLRIEKSKAHVLKDYSAAELSAEESEVFLILKEESGWYWCQNNKKDEGWLPMELFSS